MATATDDFTIALNVLSRVGLDGDLIGEFSKAKSTLHKMDTYNQMQAQIPPPLPQNTGETPTMSPQAGQTTNQPILP
jgi:hypothetical protein